MDLLWIYYAGNKGVDFSLDCQNALGWWKRNATTAEASRKPKQASLWSTNRAGRQKADQPTDRTQCPLITQKWYSCGQLDMFFLSWTVAWMRARLWRFGQSIPFRASRICLLSGSLTRRVNRRRMTSVGDALWMPLLFHYFCTNCIFINISVPACHFCAFVMWCRACTQRLDRILIKNKWWGETSCRLCWTNIWLDTLNQFLFFYVFIFNYYHYQWYI